MDGNGFDYGEEPNLDVETYRSEVFYKFVHDKITPLLAANTPFLLVDGAQHWPAMEKWRTKRLRETYGERTVHPKTSTGAGDVTHTTCQQPFLSILKYIPS